MTHDTREVDISTLAETMHSRLAIVWDNKEECRNEIEKALEDFYQNTHKAIWNKLSIYAEHKPRCFLFNEDSETFDHTKCDCGLTDLLKSN